ncbi:lanthionine synthetase LanC family protein [Amycolatopsis benzoatilytica]|uniref:class III lanthionine synthetase LanKC N-terminal domain-containing protein n=1 Tax=Amycolatopsis benzoatilytica TaxID=346045 RepID=UPI000370123F|nr:lanthionine synthetase LanC family protein [Amycolatopsis benzoatilytica]
MNVRQEAFCLADPWFFDRRTESPENDLVTAPPGPLWTVEDRGPWRCFRPHCADLPDQGWALEVSAAVGNAGRVLDQVRQYCREHRHVHRHLRSRSILLDHNAEYPTSSGTGALATIYPPDNNTLEHLLDDLSELLEGEVGPDIDGALRCGECPIHVRYGGFAEQWTEDASLRVPAIRRPSGALEPEALGPDFSVPAWAEIPGCVAEHLEATAPDPPHPVAEMLHRAHGTAVYLAERAGERVLIEEAWPYTGLDGDGLDATARLARKYDLLRRLAGIPGVPTAHSYTFDRRHYLVRECLPGVPLDVWLARHYPLAGLDCPSRDLAGYRARALSVLSQADRIVAAARERGVALDNPRDLLIARDGTVSLTGFTSDETPLRLRLFLPLAPVHRLVPERVRRAAEFAERRFSLPDGYADSVAPPAEPPRTQFDETRPDWPLVRKQIAEAVLNCATPHRTDRLFPGDIDQFRIGGTGFGVGAAGVLHSLHVTGAGRYPDHEQWLLDAVRRDPPRRAGFFDGSSGVAYVLEEFGYRDEASELLAASRGLADQTVGHDLASGLAGIGLTRLHLAGVRRDNEFGRQALDTGVRLAESLDTAEPPDGTARAGLLHGWAGPALLFLRLYERTGEPAWLSFADQALERDLEECVPAPDGSLPVRDDDRGLRREAGVGSAGILIVAEQLARLRPDARSARCLTALRVACRSEFVLHPGLLNGRCGLAAALAFSSSQDRCTRDAIDRHLARLSWHAVPFHGGLAFPGTGLLRLSADVATGSAGVLCTLAALQDGTELLPFLGPTPRPRVPRAVHEPSTMD